MSEIWLIIWRFQPFHNGHKLLIDTSLNENESTLVLIWSSNVVNDDNPYNYDLRKKIIQANNIDQKINIQALPDFPDDLQWGTSILKSIPKNTTILSIYFWDKNSDSAIKSIKSIQHIFPYKINYIEIPRSIIPISATQIRKALQNNDLKILNTYLSKVSKNIIKNQA